MARRARKVPAGTVGKSISSLDEPGGDSPAGKAPETAKEPAPDARRAARLLSRALMLSARGGLGACPTCSCRNVAASLSAGGATTGAGEATAARRSRSSCCS